MRYSISCSGYATAAAPKDLAPAIGGGSGAEGDGGDRGRRGGPRQAAMAVGGGEEAVTDLGLAGLACEQRRGIARQNCALEGVETWRTSERTAKAAVAAKPVTRLYLGNTVRECPAGQWLPQGRLVVPAGGGRATRRAGGPPLHPHLPWFLCPRESLCNPSEN